MSEGYVYILVNPSMPGVVKIGKTTRTVQQRCDELWQTGVPTPFEIFAEFYSPNCHALERDVHLALSSHRVSASREFFTILPSDAEEEVSTWHRKQIEELIERFIPGHALVHQEMALDDLAVSNLADALCVHPFKAVRVLEMVCADEAHPALVRHDEMVERILNRSSGNGWQ